MNLRSQLKDLEDERDDLLDEVSALNQGNKVLEARVKELEKENRKLKHVLDHGGATARSSPSYQVYKHE